MCVATALFRDVSLSICLTSSALSEARLCAGYQPTHANYMFTEPPCHTGRQTDRQTETNERSPAICECLCVYLNDREAVYTSNGARAAAHACLACIWLVISWDILKLLNDFSNSHTLRRLNVDSQHGGKDKGGGNLEPEGE